MNISNTYIPAPKVDAKTLWQMNADDFNSWRKINDYPRIIFFFKEKLPLFNEWMNDQLVTDDILIEYTPSKLIQEVDKVYIYTVFRNDVIKKVVDEKLYSIGDFYHHNFIVQNKIEIVPYITWYYSTPNRTILPIGNRKGSGRHIYFMHELELLDLGNICLDDNFRVDFKVNNGINSRSLNLDFVNLNDLSIKYFTSAHDFRIWFSTVENVSIEGGFHFMNAYSSTFFCFSDPKKTNLKLSNGSFQRWSIKDCRLDLNAVNSNIEGWNFQGFDLYFTMSNSDISNCNFSVSKIKYNHYYKRATELHSTLKRLYSQIGKRKIASNHFYLEKKYERKSFYYSKDNYKDEFYNYKKDGMFWILLFYIRYAFKYLKSSLLNALWGYSEKPERVFYFSISIILFCTLTYYFYPNSAIKTKENFVNSFYYSVVTFTTLGYGDILQNDNFLKILSAIEALLGMTFWGILIAGFTNNSKDY
jgi:hypothetical protein